MYHLANRITVPVSTGFQLKTTGFKMKTPGYKIGWNY